MTPQMTEGNFRSMIDLAKGEWDSGDCSLDFAGSGLPMETGVAPVPKIGTLNDWLKGYCVNHSVTYLDYCSAMVGWTAG